MKPRVQEKDMPPNYIDGLCEQLVNFEASNNDCGRVDAEF